MLKKTRPKVISSKNNHVCLYKDKLKMIPPELSLETTRQKVISSKYNRVCFYKYKLKVIPRSSHLMQLNQR